MDAIDRQLIALLREDARRPLKTLGAAVGLSRSSVRERIGRLVERGQIRRFTIEVAPIEQPVRALLLLKLALTPDPDLVARLAARAEIVRLYSLSGPIDLVAEVTAAGIEEVNRCRDEVAQLPGVVDLETAFVLKVDKAPPNGL
jgi:Lrp/AsnC family transcriptional regulator, leucine-responsive regulatory protein